MTLRLVIQGRPVSWKRAGNRKGGKGRRTLDSMKNAKRRVAGHGYIAMREAGLDMLEGPLVMRCDFYLKRKRTAVPDVDNLFKLVADALQGVAYANDSQIVRKEGEKHDTQEVGGIPRTVITITHAPAVVRQVPKARAS